MKVLGGTLIVEPGEVVEGDIVPTKKEELHRDIIVKERADVKGSIVGGRVHLYPGCVVRGGILASQILFNLQEEAETSSYNVIKVEGDLASLSTVTITEIDLSLLDKSRTLIYVKGNIVAPYMVRVANTIVEGNIASSKVELRNVISRGFLGIVRTKQSKEREEPSRISNSIVSTIVSNEDVEISDILGILFPMMYFSQGARVKGEGEVRVLRLRPTKEALNRLTSFLTREWRLDDQVQTRTGVTIMQLRPTLKNFIEDLVKNNLYTLRVSNLSGLIALVGIECVPFVKKIREEELVESLSEVLLKSS